MVLTKHQRGYHVRVSVTGKPERVYLFHGVLSELDGDWPYETSYNPSRDVLSLVPNKDKMCDKCRGVYWRSPRILSTRLRRLGKQFGVNVKVRSFARVKKCFV